MKCSSCLYLEATHFKFCVKRPSYLPFRDDSISQVQHSPDSLGSETYINQHEERPIKGVDLAELEPKPVGNR
jgi:hypothetical protein